jgi:hypothetical protein
VKLWLQLGTWPHFGALLGLDGRSVMMWAGPLHFCCRLPLQIGEDLEALMCARGDVSELERERDPAVMDRYFVGFLIFAALEIAAAIAPWYGVLPFAWLVE